MISLIFRSLQRGFRRAVAFVKNLNKRGKIIGAILIFLLICGIFMATRGGGDSAQPTTTKPSVEVRLVSDLISDSAPLSVAGTVSSKSEATVRAEKAGEVRSLRFQLGDNVIAGAIVAEIENASERAAVLQAEAGVESARASASASQSGLTGAQGSAVTALLSAYAAIQNALEGTTDQMFIEGNTFPPTYKLRVLSDAERAKEDAEKLRVVLDAVLERYINAASMLSSSNNLAAEITKTEGELRQVRTLLDLLIIALNEGKTDTGVSEDDLADYRAEAIASRTAITTALTNLTSARETLTVAQANSQGGSSASAASLKQAQATLAAARANLEHTIIRAPISGTINSLNLKLGNFVQLTAPVPTVANNGALEVVAYVTDADAKEITMGGDVTLSTGAKGAITRIAPAIDPFTKKIEIRVGITSDSQELVNGQSVTLEIARAQNTAATQDARITIPLPALKIGAEHMVVFSVDSENRLVAHPVTIGALLGDRVEIIEGISSDMRIVIDGRGLREGAEVVVK